MLASENTTCQLSDARIYLMLRLCSVANFSLQILINSTRPHKIVIKKIAFCLMSIFTIVDSLIRRDNYRFR